MGCEKPLSQNKDGRRSIHYISDPTLGASGRTVVGRFHVASMTNPDTPKSIEVGRRRIRAGEKRQFRYDAVTTYHGDVVEIPVTVINGHRGGPSVFLTAAIHGDELNGIKIVQEVAETYEPRDLSGRLVCLHVVNVPGFLSGERYVPIDGEDLNRSFPGQANGGTGKRLAHTIYHEFIDRCDVGLDFHTSTRGRTTMYHVRADMQDPGVARVAQAVGTNVILDGPGMEGTLRSVASAAGIPTVTIEMGRAHRFESVHIDRGKHCVGSVLAEFDMIEDRPVAWPGWRRIVGRGAEKRWIRAETGGLVTREWGSDPLVEADDVLFRITDHFSEHEETVRAPFTGLVIGALESGVAYPGHPLCHFVRVDAETAEIIREDIDRGAFERYHAGGFQLARLDE